MFRAFLLKGALVIEDEGLETVAEGKADADPELDTVADEEAVAEEEEEEEEEEEGVAEADTVGMVHPVLLGLLLLP